MQWYYAENGQQKGPVDDTGLDQLVEAGLVRDDTLVWHENLANWQAHSAVRGPRSPNPVAIPSDSAVRYCGQCGLPFPSSELVAIGPASVCASCKPGYLQRLREGGAQTVGSRRFGGFWIRFAARLIDGILLQAVFLVVRIPFGVGLFSAGAAPDVATVGAAVGAGVVIALLSVVVSACYEIFFIAKRGATIGKMIFGLKVIRSDGSRLSLGLATGRYFAQWLSSITLAIGYIMAAFDSEKRALHDRICETRVIYSK